jgi:hypothetical protein
MATRGVGDEAIRAEIIKIRVRSKPEITLLTAVA